MQNGARGRLAHGLSTSNFAFCILHLVLVDLDDAPALTFFRRGVDAGVGERGSGLWLRHARERVALHLADDVLIGRRRGAAVQAHPQAEQWIGEAVALLP